MLLTSKQITVKSGHEISHFSPTGLVFDDGSRVMADLVIFATGYIFQTFMVPSDRTLLTHYLQVLENHN
jgi:NADH dehydrogenase FAD-containing subunit